MRKNVPKRAMPDGQSVMFKDIGLFPLDIFRRYTSAINEQVKMTNEGDASPIFPEGIPSSPSPHNDLSDIGAIPKVQSLAQCVSSSPVSVHMNNVPDKAKCGNESTRKDDLGATPEYEPTPALFNENGSSALIGNSIHLNPISSNPVELPISIGQFFPITTINGSNVTSPIPTDEKSLATLCLGRELNLHLGREW